MQRIGVFVVVFLLAAIAAFSQVDAARIAGLVRDGSGSIVSAAQVAFRNRDTGWAEKVVTNGDGLYVSPPLAPGDYEVEIVAPGFAPVVQNLRLEVAQRASVDVSLKPGAVKEVVNVEAAAAEVSADTSTLSNLRTETSVKNLPLNGRNFAELMGLTAGVTPAQSQITGSIPLSQVRGETGYSVNGLRLEDNHFLLDGISDNENHNGLGIILFPPLDAVQEFREETSVPDARYGRGGGGTVNLVFKSGTEQFHGDIFEYLRNSDLDAKNYFDKSKPPFHMNQFGGTLGGPLGGKDSKTYFFVDYQGDRVAQGLTSLSTVPVVAFRNGDFSSAAQQIFDPTTTVQNANGTYSRTPFPGNKIPAAQLNAVGQNLINLYPEPNEPGLVNNYLYQPTRTVVSDEFDIKIDHRFSDRNYAFARYSRARDDIYQPGTLPTPAVGGSISGYSAEPSQQAVVSDNHIFSPTLVNNFRAGWSRIAINSQDLNAGQQLGNQLGIPGSNVAGNPLTYGAPYVTVTGAATLGSYGNTPAIIISNNYQYDDSVSLVRGRHTIQIGAEFQRLQYNVFQTLNERGTLNFTTAYTSNPASTAASGIGFADLLLGVPISGSLSAIDGMRGLRQSDVSAFVQDDFRINDRLTFNIGLRYENYLGWPWTEVDNRAYNFIPSAGALEQVGTNGIPRSGVGGNDLNFMPRVGLAYRFSAKTVIRTGYGIFYSSPQVIFGKSIENNPPNSVSSAFTNNQYNFAGAWPASQGFDRPAAGNLLGAAYAIDQNAKTPYTQQWNFTLQRQLTGSAVLTAAYVGTAGIHQEGALNINQAVPGLGAVAARRPYPLYQDIQSTVDTQSSRYHALQVTAERRFSKGLDFQLAYTYSHALDYASGLLGAYSNTYNLRQDYGNADFNVPQRLVGSFTYQLPLKAANDLLNHAVRGWQVNGIASFYDGLPFSVQSATNTLNNGAASHAQYIGPGDGSLPSGQRTVQDWFNTAAFAVPGPQQWGNSGRNILQGPGTKEFDLSLFREFSLSEGSSRKLQLRSEFFNFLNSPQFNNPNATIGTSSVGTITSAGSPFTFQRLSREIQVAAKLYF
jgi:hypothetical protein